MDPGVQNPLKCQFFLKKKKKSNKCLNVIHSNLDSVDYDVCLRKTQLR